MWTKLGDELLDHRKIFEAGDRLGRNGPALALAVYVAGLMWSNKHLSDGFLPIGNVKRIPHVAEPLKVANALVYAGLWEAKPNGYQVHDFLEFNWSAERVRTHRQHDLARKQNGHRHGKKR